MVFDRCQEGIGGNLWDLFGVFGVERGFGADWSHKESQLEPIWDSVPEWVDRAQKIGWAVCGCADGS